MALGDVLLLSLVGVGNLAAIEGCAWDLGAALHLGWQITILKLLKLVLNLLLLLLGDRSTIVVVVDVLLS